MKSTSFESRRWVPITMSVEPSASRASAAFCSLGVRKRESTSVFTGKSASRSVKVRPCCSARMVVGTSTATCFPPWIALNAARTAISVLP